MLKILSGDMACEHCCMNEDLHNNFNKNFIKIMGSINQLTYFVLLDLFDLGTLFLVLEDDIVASLKKLNLPLLS